MLRAIVFSKKRKFCENSHETLASPRQNTSGSGAGREKISWSQHGKWSTPGPYSPNVLEEVFVRQVMVEA